MQQTVNELDKKLTQLNQGTLNIDKFMIFLLTIQVFLPIKDDVKQEINIIEGFDIKPKAEPLITIINDEKIMPLFSDPRKSKLFLQGYPGYQSGLLVNFGWILDRIAPDIHISINPNLPTGLDLDLKTIQQLVTLKYRNIQRE